MLNQTAFYNRCISTKDSFKLGKTEDLVAKGEKFSLVSDSMFEIMINNENNKQYGSYLISLVFDLDLEKVLKTIAIVKPKLNKDLSLEGSQTVDYVCEIDGKYYCIEMNNYSSTDALVRNVYYAMKISKDKVVKGSKTYSYHKVYQINLCNFTFEGYNKMMQYYGICDYEGNLMFDNLNFVNIYLPILKKECYNKSTRKLSKLERLLLVFCVENEKAEKIAKGDRIMEEYIKDAKEASKKPELVEAYDKELHLERLRNSELEEAKRKTLTKGIEQGKQEEKIEIAKSMIKENLDIELISKITGLSVKEIENLK